MDEWNLRGRQVGRQLLERVGIGPDGHAPKDLFAAPDLPFPIPTSSDLTSVYADCPEERTALLVRADAILDGRFDLLGFSDVEFENPIDWHRDPTREVTAPRTHWSRIQYLDEQLVGDHKIIWELNRHQWLVTLAQAWRLTGDLRYTKRITEALVSWLDANPPRCGINWSSSLELAMRAIAWTWVLHLAGKALPGEREFRRRWLATLDLHGIQIERFLSTWFSPNTHLTGEALGLLYLGTAWPDLRHAARWRATGWAILVKQCPIHLRADGTYFEQTTWYQAYTVDFFLHALLLADHANLPIPDEMPGHVARGAEVIAELARPNGTLPAIGDDDGGRLLPLGGRRGVFHDTLSLAGAVLDRPDLCAGAMIPAAFAWLMGRSAWERLRSRRVGPSRRERSRAFPLGGWYLLRGRSGSMVVDAGPHGALAGGHSHADALAFDLSIGDYAAVLDPGTGSYVGPWRNRFRATKAHNTLALADGTGSAEPKGPFSWKRWPVTRVASWIAGAGWASFHAEHDGFDTVHRGLRHRRAILFRDGWGWLVVDSLGGGSVDVCIGFQIAPGLRASVGEGAAAGNMRIVAEEDHGVLLSLIIDGVGCFSTENSIVSRGYGTAESAPRLVRRVEGWVAAEGVATLLTTEPESALVRMGGTEGISWKWQRQDEVAQVALASDGSVTARWPDSVPELR